MKGLQERYVQYLSLLAVLALGIILGWLGTGTLLSPLEWPSASPWALRPKYQMVYVDLVAERLSRTGDADFARHALGEWDTDHLNVLLAMMRVADATPEQEQRLDLLSRALELPESRWTLSSLLRQPGIGAGFALSVGLLLAAGAVALRATPCPRSDTPERVASAVRGDEPAVRGDEPAVRGDEPAVRGDEPAVRGDEPAVRGDEPAVRGDEPAVRGDEPAVSETIADGRAPVQTAQSRMPTVTDLAVVEDDQPIASGPLLPQVAAQQIQTAETTPQERPGKPLRPATWESSITGVPQASVSRPAAPQASEPKGAGIQPDDAGPTGQEQAGAGVPIAQEIPQGTLPQTPGKPDTSAPSQATSPPPSLGSKEQPLAAGSPEQSQQDTPEDPATTPEELEVDTSEEIGELLQDFLEDDQEESKSRQVLIRNLLEIDVHALAEHAQEIAEMLEAPET